jgi:DnaJ-class molecular chaperone
VAKDYYNVLAVDRSASSAQIRKRFLELARERHPDKFQGEEKRRAEEEFQSITEAFNVLSNPDRRRQHDAELVQPKAQAQAADKEQLIRIHLARGVKAYRERKFVEAADNFDRATKIDEDNAQAWYYLALTCQQNPRWRKQALAAIQRACELDKMNADYHKLAGKLFLQAGMSIRAERYFKLALQWGGPDPEVEKTLADLKKG